MQWIAPESHKVIATAPLFLALVVRPFYMRVSLRLIKHNKSYIASVPLNNAIGFVLDQGCRDAPHVERASQTRWPCSLVLALNALATVPTDDHRLYGSLGLTLHGPKVALRSYHEQKQSPLSPR